MPQKREIYGVFTVFLKFLGKRYKKYSIGNEDGIELETACNNYISSVADKTNAHAPKNKQYFYFSLTLKDTETFPKLLF